MLNIRKISAISRTYRNLGRYREILAILFKYGFGEVIDLLKIEQYLEISMQMLFKKQPKNIDKLSRPQRIRLALEELGPTFIKFGQILSTRPDLIPYEYAKELEKLQDDVPPFDYHEVRRQVWEDFGKSLDIVFPHFEEEPVAAASIGQVHRARLESGEDVVIKVQRPNIRKIIETDLEIMLHLGYLMERHLVEFEIQPPTRLVSVFARTIEKEINYKIEAANIERFGRQFLDDATIYVPKVYHDLTTKHILTMEYVDGIKVSEFNTLRDEGYDLKILADRGSALLMSQFFVHGFFHADPHPGNILILPGNVRVYAKGDFLGETSIGLKAPRETFRLGTRTAYDVKAEKKLLEKDTEKAGLTRGKHRRGYQYQLEIKSFSKEPLDIRIVDRIPHSNSEKIQVEFKPLDLPPKKNVMGVLEWEVEIEAQKEFNIKYTFEVEWERDLTIRPPLP